MNNASNKSFLHYFIVFILYCSISGSLLFKSANAQAPAKISFEFHPNDFLRYEFGEIGFNIVLNNESLFEQNLPRLNVSLITTQIYQISDSVTDYYDLYAVNRDIPLTRGTTGFYCLIVDTVKSLKWNVYLEWAFSFENDASLYTARITTKGEDPPLLILSGFTVAPGEYTPVVEITEFDDRDSVALETKTLKEGSSEVWQIRDRGILDSLYRSFLTTENIYIAIIGALITALGTVLRNTLAASFRNFLDWLGKYAGGKLAERRFLCRYIENIIHNHKFLRVVGFDRTGINRPRLEEVFVSLQVSAQSQQPTGAITDKVNGANREHSTITYAQALRGNKRMVILGGPGAGKTTTLSYALLAFAKNKAALRLGINKELLPIFIPLRRLSKDAKSIVEDITDPESKILSANLLREYPDGLFEKLLKAGKCIILFDGLDEVTDQTQHLEIARRINNLVADYPDNRFVVTCRTAGWRNLLADFTIFQAQDFSREEIHRFVRGWHRAVITEEERSLMKASYPDKKEFKEKWSEHKKTIVDAAIDIQSRKLIGAIDRSSRIMAIAVNPMLMSLIALVHYKHHILPRGRTILYSQCIQTLIDAWDRTRDIMSTVDISPDQKETIVREVAFEFQRQGKGEDSRENLERKMTEVIARVGVAEKAVDLLKNIEQRSGLLIERSIDVLGFSHLTLQEYLAAKHIYNQPSLYDYLLKNFDNQEWREVILLYAGLVDDATDFINDILKTDSVDRLILAGHCLGDSKRVDPMVAGKIISKLEKMLETDDIHRDEVISVLSEIAADYENEPANLEQQLSARLISTLDDEKLDERDLVAMKVLSNARVTAALPAMVKFLESDQHQDVAVAAIGSFGNLSLPTLSGLITDCIKPGSYEVSSRTFLSFVQLGKTLELINTGAAAKLLVGLVFFLDFLFSPSDEQSLIAENQYLTVLALSRMLRDPGIESEILELQQNEIINIHMLGKYRYNTKQSLSYAKTEVAWPNENGRESATFKQIDYIIRKSIYLLFRYYEKPDFEPETSILGDEMD